MMKLNEYDVVRATKMLSDVPAGSEGTIVMVYEHPSLGYEVEFMDGGETLDVLTVEPEDIELVIPVKKTSSDS
jgi:hypothetical protein